MGVGPIAFEKAWAVFSDAVVTSKAARPTDRQNERSAYTNTTHVDRPPCNGPSTSELCELSAGMFKFCAKLSFSWICVICVSSQWD